MIEEVEQRKAVPIVSEVGMQGELSRVMHAHEKHARIAQRLLKIRTEINGLAKELTAG